MDRYNVNSSQSHLTLESLYILSVVFQLGKLESEDEASVMTVKTKKRVVRIRQPSNIHFKLKSIHGIPKQTTYVLSNTPSSTISSQVTSEKQEGDDESLPPLPPPPKSLSDASTPEELLQWTLKHYHGLYNQHAVLHRVIIPTLQSSLD